MARIPAFQAGGPGSIPGRRTIFALGLRRHLRHHVGRHPKTQVHGGLAQSVECALCKREAPGSKPGFSTIFTVTPFALVAQMVERKTLNLVVVGSIPTEGVFTQRGFESPYLLHVVDNVKRSGPMV